MAPPLTMKHWLADERFLGLKHSIAKYPETIEVEYMKKI